MFSPRKMISTLVFLVLLISLGGCSSVTVNYDYDNNVDWNKFKTYGWMPGGSVQDDPTGALPNTQLLNQRIQSSVKYEMEQRGITESDDPDLLVVYHLGAKEKIQVTDWGYSYSDYYWGYGGRQIDVQQFTEGSLVIDLVDAESKSLVWRGTGTGVVDKSQKSPEQKQADADEVINKILKNFPPK